MNDYLATLSTTGRDNRQKYRNKIADLYEKVKAEEDFINGQKYEKDKVMMDQASKTMEYYNKEIDKQYDLKNKKEEECEAAIREAEAIFERDMEELKRKRDAKIKNATTWRDNRVKQIDQEVNRLQGLIQNKEAIIENGAPMKATKALHTAKTAYTKAKEDYRYIFINDPQPLPGEPDLAPVALKPKKTVVNRLFTKEEMEDYIREDPEERALAAMREETRRQIERDARDRRMAEEAKREEDLKLYEMERRMQEEKEEQLRQARAKQPQPLPSYTEQEEQQEEEDSDIEDQIAEAKARLYQKMKIGGSWLPVFSHPTAEKMPFEKLTHIKINKKTGKPLSPNSVKAYKTILNRIAETGIDTKEKLVEESPFVIALINAIYDQESSVDKDIKRKFYSAIFYALDEYPLDKQKPYYDEFVKAKEFPEE